MKRAKLVFKSHSPSLAAEHIHRGHEHNNLAWILMHAAACIHYFRMGKRNMREKKSYVSSRNLSRFVLFCSIRFSRHRISEFSFSFLFMFGFPFWYRLHSRCTVCVRARVSLHTCDDWVVKFVDLQCKSEKNFLFILFSQLVACLLSP